MPPMLACWIRRAHKEPVSGDSAGSPILRRSCGSGDERGMHMPMDYTADLHVLVWTVALCLVQMIVAVAGATLQVGLPRLAGNREPLPALSGPGGPSARIATCWNPWRCSRRW